MFFFKNFRMWKSHPVYTLYIRNLCPRTVITRIARMRNQSPFKNISSVGMDQFCSICAGSVNNDTFSFPRDTLWVSKKKLNNFCHPAPPFKNQYTSSAWKRSFSEFLESFLKHRLPSQLKVRHTKFRFEIFLKT